MTGYAVDVITFLVISLVLTNLLAVKPLALT